MTNTEILQQHFGEDAVHLEVNGRSAFGFNKYTGELTHQTHNFPVRLVSQIKSATEHHILKPNEIVVFRKESSYTLYAPKVKGRHKYYLTTTVRRVGDKILCDIHSGLVQIIANEYLDDPINAAVKAKAIELNDTGKSLEDFVSYVFHTYELDEPELSWDGYEADFNIELSEKGTANIDTVITKDGEEEDLDLFRITYFPEHSETGEQIGDSWFGEQEETIGNDFRVRGVRHLTSDKVRMKCILQMREEDGDYINKTIERDLHELVGHFEEFNYWKD